MYLHYQFLIQFSFVVSTDFTNLHSYKCPKILSRIFKMVNKSAHTPEVIKFHLIYYFSDISLTYFDGLAQCTFSFFLGKQKEKTSLYKYSGVVANNLFSCFDVFTSCVHNCIFTRVYTQWFLTYMHYVLISLMSLVSRPNYFFCLNFHA